MLENSLGLPLLEEFLASLIYPTGKKLSRESKQSISRRKSSLDTYLYRTSHPRDCKTCSLYCLDLLLLGSAPSCLASFRAFLETHCQPLVSQSTTPSHSDSESWTAPRGCGESFAPQKHSRCHSRQTLLNFRHFCKWQYHPQLLRGGAMQIPRCTHNWLQFEAVVNSSTAWRTSGTWGSQAAPASQSTLQAGSEWICTICISITY